MYAVFIEPQGPLKEFIISYKEKVWAIFPGQPYCDHPPHSTLFASCLIDSEYWLEELKAVVHTISPFLCRIRNTIVFWDDIMTGGHSIALKIEPSDALYSLQRIVGDVLAAFVRRYESCPLSELYKNEPFQSSYLKYGFAFLGEHWIPHFSIASLKIPKDDPFIAEFRNIRPVYDIKVNEISVWRVEGDKHSWVAALKLKEE